LSQRLGAGVLASLLLAAGALPAAGQSLQIQPFATGLSFPVAFLGDPTAANRHFVVEKTGLIRVLVNGVPQSTPFLDLTSLVSGGSEQGLLGMALDPNYATNRRFYVFFTRQDDPGTLCSPVNTGCEFGGLVVARYTRSVADPLVANATGFRFRWGSPTGRDYIEHFNVSEPSQYANFSNHNGGTLAFGPDGYLYIGTGDGGGGYDRANNAQNPNLLLGKMLRIDVNVTDANAQGYQVPPDNPFVDNDPIDALPEIWAFGVRNPWKFSFDDPSRGGSGAMWIADVGQDRWEEINREPAGQGGQNYGWRIREGSRVEFIESHRVPGTQPAWGTEASLTNPVFEYSHVAGEAPIQGRSVTGGYIYRGSDLSARWRGRYFFADFVSARIWSAQVAAGTGAFSDIVDHTDAWGGMNVSSFGVDQRGELYIVRYGASNAGVVYRLCEVFAAGGLTTFSAAGGTGTLAITTQPGCATTVSSTVPWLGAVSDSTANGARTVVFRVAPNAGGTRQTDITVAGLRVSVTQTSAAPVVGDLDNNGMADLLWHHADGRTAVWLMNRARMIAAEPLGPGSLADTGWRMAASGDFNRDGNSDVLFQHQGDGRLAVWFMSGSVLLAADAVTPGSVPDVNWKIRGAADFDRDGWPDLAWQHQTSGAIAVWLMNGIRLRSAINFSPGSVADLNWRIVGTGDMNADGHMDLVWQHQANGSLATWLMNGTAMRSAILLSPAQVADTNWKIRAVADLNGDRRPDLVWHHQTSGLLSVWFMNGTRSAEAVSMTPGMVSDINWQIVGPR
jgi:glucose/arabinose dehydrogenase